MAVVALEGLRFFSKHGFYEEERTLGTEFIIDVYVETLISSAAKSDKLTDTINYEIIYLLCQAEMKKPTKLIETVAQQILERIVDHFPAALGVRVRLRKMHPPLGGPVHSAFVEVESGSLGWPKLGTLKKLKSLVEDWRDMIKKFEQL